MPITLTVPENILDPAAEAKVFAELTDALLDIEGLQDNAFMVPNVVGTLHTLPRNRIFSGGAAALAAFVELKLPAVALASPDSKRRFVERATRIVAQASGGRIVPERVWVNVVYAADGAWGIGGQAYDNAALGGAIQAAALAR
ncbi:tautomerase family protein [Trinickia diaoshuihuensis]|jgi:phenylpyruvate tautomerase PptA (4-oxalocrotonate tautomerase family)|uniref:tautomerase family protein n=1 Tax=Trinickia diaoshuihuensis TaxID=2292265 RepID=UPI000E230C3B|nr:Tautomerase enzyme [Trinickia diaoshuihuensis]